MRAGQHSNVCQNYNMSRSKAHDNSIIKVKSDHTICELVWYHLSIDYDKLKIYYKPERNH